MIEIFVDQISERLVYTLNFVFHERGLQYKLNNDFYTFSTSTNIKFNYSERHFENIPQLIPSSVLFDEAIFTYAIDRGLFEEEFCLTFNRVLDPLASIFYVLSRMEEYLDSRQDEHGRFITKNSVLSKYNWLDKAICDRWAVDFLLHLSKYTGLENNFYSHFVDIIPTFDIDNTYAYQWKAGWRKFLSIGRDIILRDKERLSERRLVLSGASYDPYDTFEYIEQIASKGFKVKLFWLLGDYAKYDKNISYQDHRHKKLIADMSKFTPVGIHPSYKSNSYPHHVKNEIERLESILDEPVYNSRQHFLRLNISNTYSCLVKLGIQHDYTMGFADQVGFRAGTGRSFKWFDLNKNIQTDLTIHPFVYMDGTLNEYLKITPDESKKIIHDLYKELSKFGGDLCCIWHNETIGNYRKWFGWKDVLEYTLSLKNSF